MCPGLAEVCPDQGKRAQNGLAGSKGPRGTQVPGGDLMRSQRIKSVAPPVAPSRWGLFFSAAGPGIFPAPQSSGPSCSERRPDRGTPQAHSPDRHRSARQGTQGKPRAPAIFLQHSQCCRFLGLLRRLGGTWPGCRRRARETPEAQPAPDRPRSARWGTQEQPTPPAIYLPRWPTWQIVGDSRARLRLAGMSSSRRMGWLEGATGNTDPRRGFD